MNKEEVEKYIDKVENHTVISCSSVMSILYPIHKKIDKKLLGGPGATIVFGGKNKIVYDYFEEFQKFQNDQINNIDYIKFNMMPMVVMIHDILRKNNMTNYSPEFEFLRHVRNAIGHGNEFMLKNNEPRRLAQFEHLKIERSLNGMKNVFFNFIKPADVLYLTQYIKNHL